MAKTLSIWTAAFCLLGLLPAAARSAANITALRGLALVSALAGSEEGRMALDANLRVMGDTQSGAAKPPLLVSFEEQRQLALREASISDGNATELADGLGSKVGGLYQAQARYTDPETFTNVAASVADLIGYTNNVAKSDSNAGKSVFANATKTGKAPVSDAARAILAERGGTVDVFGRAYGRPAGTLGPMPMAIRVASRPCLTCSRIPAPVISVGRRTASIGCAGRART